MQPAPVSTRPFQSFVTVAFRASRTVLAPSHGHVQRFDTASMHLSDVLPGTGTQPATNRACMLSSSFFAAGSEHATQVDKDEQKRGAYSVPSNEPCTAGAWFVDECGTYL